MKLSIVLGSYNRLSYLKLTIDSIRKEISDYKKEVEIIVVDGGSTDGSSEWLIKQKDVISMIQHNRGEWQGKKIERRSWGYFMNLAFKAASGKYVCMLSDDCLIIPGAINNALQLFEQRLHDGIKLGGLAFYWRNWPKVQYYMVLLTLAGKMHINHGIYLKQALDEVDYINDCDYQFYYADGDLSLKLWKAGYCIEAAEDSYIEHYAHANMKVRKTNFYRERQDWQKYTEKWADVFPYNEKDPTRIEKQYTDPSQTVKMFLTAQPIHEKFIRFIKHLISIIRR